MTRNKSGFILFAVVLTLCFIFIGCVSVPDTVDTSTQEELAPGKIDQSVKYGSGESIVVIRRLNLPLAFASKTIIWLDEKPVFKLRNGYRRSMVVPNGKHTIQAGTSNTDKGSPLTFTVNSEQVVIDTWPTPGVMGARFGVTESDKNKRIKLPKK